MPEGGAPALHVPPAAVAAFVAYLALMVGIGLWASRKSAASLGDFFLAGRGLGRVVVALSAVTSGRSGWLLLGFSGLAWARGLSAVWALLGYTVVEFFLFREFGRRLRRLSGAADCITVPDVFAARFGEGAVALRVVLVLVMLVFITPYAGAQFLAGGKAFHGAFGLDQNLGVALTGGIVLAYTVLGGFLAVSLTDVVQALFMLTALIALPLMAIADLGGAGALVEQLAAQDPALVDPFAIGAGALLGFVGIGLGSPGSPHIIVRAMSIRDPGQLRFAAWVGLATNVGLGAGALCIGLAGRAYWPEAALLPGGDRENIYPLLAQGHLPPVLFGVVIASIFAAIMSTCDSQLLVAASAVTRDLREQVFGRGRPLDGAAGVRLSRLVIVGITLLGLLVAWAGGQLVFWLVLFAWAGLGAALGPATILMLFWRRTTGAGALAGVLAGTAVATYWNLSGRAALLAATGFDLYELVPAFAAGLLATVLVSLVTRPPADAARHFAIMRGE